MKKITYIFGDGRLDKISQSDKYAKDFFYGFQLLEAKDIFKSKILEIHPFSNTKNIFLNFLLQFDKLLNKITFLQFHFY